MVRFATAARASSSVAIGRKMKLDRCSMRSTAPDCCAAATSFCVSLSSSARGGVVSPCSCSSCGRSTTPKTDGSTIALGRVVGRHGDDRPVGGHEQRHAERDDEERRPLDGGHELEHGHGLHLVPADHDCPSRTTRRKMSSIGASIGSKRSMTAPALTSDGEQAGRADAVGERDAPGAIAGGDDRRGRRHLRQRPARVHRHLRQRVLTTDIVDGAVDHQLPLIDQRDAIAERLDLIHVVRGQNRRPAAAPPLEQQILHQAHVDRIEAGRRLVEDAELRVAEEHAGNLHLLRHALAQTIHPPRGHVRQLHLLQPLERPPPRFRTRQPLQRAEVGHHVADGELGVETAFLGKVPEPVEMLAPARLAEAPSPCRCPAG